MNVVCSESEEEDVRSDGEAMLGSEENVGEEWDMNFAWSSHVS